MGDTPATTLLTSAGNSTLDDSEDDEDF